MGDGTNREQIELTRQLQRLLGSINSELHTQLQYQTQIAAAAGAEADELRRRLGEARETAGRPIRTGAPQASGEFNALEIAAGAAKDAMARIPDEIRGAARAQRDITSQYRDEYGKILSDFGGGLDYMTSATNDQASRLVDVTESTLKQFYDFTTEGTEALGQPLFMLFDNYDDLMRDFQHITTKRTTDTFAVLSDENENLAVEMRLLSKNLSLNEDQLATFVSRAISIPGKTINEMFREVQGFADQVEKQTGISSKMIVGNVEKIIRSTETFGNVTVEEATRISATLTQVGIDFDSLNGIVGQFQSYEQAATAVGNLTSVFGVNIDAMEMMMLANEDQEQFLHRMREQLLDAGVETENLTLAQKQLLKSQLQFGDIEAVERFLDPSAAISSFEELQQATDPTAISEDLESMIDDIRSLDDAVMVLDRFKMSMTGLVGAEMSRDMTRFSQNFSRMAGSSGDFIERLTGVSLDAVRNKMESELGDLEQTLTSEIGGAISEVPSAAGSAADSATQSFENLNRTILDMSQSSLQRGESIREQVQSMSDQVIMYSRALDSVVDASSLGFENLDRTILDMSQGMLHAGDTARLVWEDMLAEGEITQDEFNDAITTNMDEFLRNAGDAGIEVAEASADAMLSIAEEVNSALAANSEMTDRQFRNMADSAGSLQQSLAILFAQSGDEMREAGSSAQAEFMQKFNLTQLQMTALAQSEAAKRTVVITEEERSKEDLLEGYASAGTSFARMVEMGHISAGQSAEWAAALEDPGQVADITASATQMRIDALTERPEAEAAELATAARSRPTEGESGAMAMLTQRLETMFAAGGAGGAGDNVYNITLEVDGTALSSAIVRHPVGDGGTISIIPSNQASV